MRPSHDLVGHDVAGPTFGDCTVGVPLPCLPGIQLVQENSHVPPRQLANSLLANWLRPSQRERPHVLRTRGESENRRAAAGIGLGRRTIPLSPPKVDYLGCPAVCWETVL